MFDNNEVDGEKFEDDIGDYINSGFVELINCRGLRQAQLKAYNECYERFNKYYDWIMFYDADEFVNLKDFKSMKSYLNDKRFEECEKVQLNWVYHTDNGKLYYEDKPLKERFPEIDKYARENNSNIKREVKSALRGNLTNINIFCPHALVKKNKNCNGYGKREKSLYFTEHPDFHDYYIDHYCWKSTFEFISTKLNRTDAIFDSNFDFNTYKIKIYFDMKLQKKKLI